MTLLRRKSLPGNMIHRLRPRGHQHLAVLASSPADCRAARQLSPTDEVLGHNGSDVTNKGVLLFVATSIPRVRGDLATVGPVVMVSEG